jgi:hypothetical protein
MSFVVRIVLTEERSLFFVVSRGFDFFCYRQGGTFDFAVLLPSFEHLDVIMALLSESMLESNV